MKTLSKRENQIIELVALGYSVSEIADILYISAETVRKTISNIKAKVELNKSTELAADYWCKRFGSLLEEERKRVLMRIEEQRQFSIRKAVISTSLMLIVILSSPFDQSDKRTVRPMRARRYRTEQLIPA